MSKGHKDLPAGSQPWASEVDKGLARIKELEAIIRRLAENAGIDMANPTRGINPGDTPNVGTPVGQKVSSLADVDTYNVLDGQVLSWTQQGQKWLPIDPPQTGINWQLATEEEHLYGDLDPDSDYYSTQVIGLYDPYPPGVDYNTGGTGDGYGLVGTNTAGAFLHGAQRWNGGPTRAHGYVAVQPYYVKMGCQWINDENGSTWDEYGEIGVSRGDVYLNTAINRNGAELDSMGYPVDDGGVFINTNWFYLPRVNGVLNSTFNINWPRRPIPQGSSMGAGACVYDINLKKPIFWQGTKWVDAMGNDIPAPSY